MSFTKRFLMYGARDHYNRPLKVPAFHCVGILNRYYYTRNNKRSLGDNRFFFNLGYFLSLTQYSFLFFLTWTQIIRLPSQSKNRIEYRTKKRKMKKKKNFKSRCLTGWGKPCKFLFELSSLAQPVFKCVFFAQLLISVPTHIDTHLPRNPSKRPQNRTMMIKTIVFYRICIRILIIIRQSAFWLIHKTDIFRLFLARRWTA